MSIHDQPLVFHTSHGQILPVEITSQTTAGEVKNILCNQASEYQMNDSDLIYNNEPLQDDQKISEIDPNLKQRIFILADKGAALQKFIFKNLIFGTYSLQLDPKTITKIIKKHFIEAHPELIPESIIFKYDRKNIVCDDEKALEEFGTDTIKVTAKKVQQTRSQSKGAAAPPKRSPAAPPRVAPQPSNPTPQPSNPEPTPSNPAPPPSNPTLSPSKPVPPPQVTPPKQDNIPKQTIPEPNPNLPSPPVFQQQPEPIPQQILPSNPTIPQQPEVKPQIIAQPDLSFNPQNQIPPTNPVIPQQPSTPLPPPASLLSQQETPQSKPKKQIILEIEPMERDPIDAPTPLPDHNFNGFTPSERQLESIRACLTDSPEILNDFYKWVKRINPQDAKILRRNQKTINRLLHIIPKESPQIEAPQSSDSQNQQQTSSLNAPAAPPPVKPPKIYEEKYKLFLEFFKEDKAAQKAFTNLHKKFATLDPADLFGVFVSCDKDENEVSKHLASKPI